MRGHHLSDIWSLDLDKLDQFQNQKIIIDKNTSSSQMKIAFDGNKNSIKTNNTIIKNNANQAPISFSTLNSSKLIKNKMNPIKKIIYDMNKYEELIPIEDDITIAKNFIGKKDFDNGIHL